MTHDDLHERLAAADPTRGDHAATATALRARVLQRAVGDVASAPARRAPRGWRRLALATATATAGAAAVLALLPGDRPTPSRGPVAGLPGSPVAAFAQELRQPGILHATTVTRGSVDAEGRLDDGGRPVRIELWYAVDGSRWRDAMWIGDDTRPFETVWDGGEYRSYRVGDGFRGSHPKTNDPGAPLLNGEPFVARTLRLAERLEKGQYSRLGTDVLDGRRVVVIGTDQQPGDAYPVDQRFSISEDESRPVRIETLELPFEAGTTPAEYTWQREDVLEFEIVDDDEATRAKLDVSPALRADTTPAPYPPMVPPGDAE